MVLIEDLLTLLLMVLICPPVTCWRSKCCCCYWRRHQDGTPPAPVVSSNIVAAESRPAANNGNHEMDQQGQDHAGRPMPGTIQWMITTATATAANSTPRNTVYIFLLHYNCFYIVFIVVSIVFLVRLASGDNSSNESIVLHTIVCVLIITRWCVRKLTHKLLVYRKKFLTYPQSC